MTARNSPPLAMLSWKALASSGGIGFVFRSIRGLREKIWMVSPPTDLPRTGASAMLSEIETWAPRRTVFPPVGILGPRMSFAGLSIAKALVHRIRRGGPAGLHNEVRKGQMPLPPVEGVREFLPAAVLHPSADRRVSEEQFDLSEILERDRGRVDAEELDLEAVLRQQIAHRILVEGPSRTAARLLPMVAVVGAENEGPSRPQGSRRMPHDLRGHAQIADHGVDRVAREFVVGRLLGIAEDEFDVPKVPDPGVRSRVHELHAVEVHADDVAPQVRHDECEPALPRAEV